MSDNALVVAVAFAIAISIGFVANCEKNKNALDTEIRKARIERGLEKE